MKISDAERDRIVATLVAEDRRRTLIDFWHETTGEPGCWIAPCWGDIVDTVLGAMDERDDAPCGCPRGWLTLTRHHRGCSDGRIITSLAELRTLELG